MKLMLPGGTPLNISNAMFACAAPCNLISYRDLRAQGIHLTTDLVDGEEAIGLQRQGHTFAIAKAGSTGLYNLKIHHPTGCAQKRQGHVYAVARPPDPCHHVPSTGLGVLKRLCILPDASLTRKARVLSDAPSLRQGSHIVPDVEN